MTIDEAIKNREDCLKYLEEIGPKASPDCLEAVRWSAKALKALRPVSREQVEKAWMGCKYCDEEWGTCNPITNRFVMPPRGGIQYCPMCGKPLTDEAVEMVMERMEALHEDNSCS